MTTETAYQRCLASDYLKELTIALSNPSMLERYQASTFGLDESRLLNTPIALRGKTPNLLGPGANDATNAMLVHKYLGELRPDQATDPRLWTYLTHAEFFEYTKMRWPGERSKNRAEHVHNRFFLKGGRSGQLGNAIARLWWGAQFTYAPWERVRDLEPLKGRHTDPYVYTRRFFSTQELFQGLMARRFGSSPLVRICYLEAVERLAVGNHIPKQAATLKRLSLNLNLVSSYRVLDALPFAVLMPIMEAEARRAHAQVGA